MVVMMDRQGFFCSNKSLHFQGGLWQQNRLCFFLNPIFHAQGHVRRHTISLRTCPPSLFFKLHFKIKSYLPRVKISIHTRRENICTGYHISSRQSIPCGAGHALWKILQLSVFALRMVASCRHLQ